MSASDFKKKRLELEAAQQAIEAAKTKAAEKERKRKGRERQAKLKALTFNMDDEEEATAADSKTDSTAAAASSASTAAATSSVADAAVSTDAPPSKKAKVDSGASRASGKDPLADTSFLPDRVREAEEHALRVQLADEWKKAQELVKQEQIEIVYSYWDGSGHRNKVVVSKGMTIGQFLEKARKDMYEHTHVPMQRSDAQGMLSACSREIG